MKEILICSIPADYHVAAVRWGVERLGGVARVWVPGDVPDFLSVSISMVDDRSGVRMSSNAERFSCEDVGVVWNRRFAKPIPPDHASPHDRAAIAGECQEHVRNAMMVLSEHAVAVNHPSGQYDSNLKALQIGRARKAGLAVQPTLFSNDFDEIRSFHDGHAPVVAKPYRPFLWMTEDGPLSRLTFEMPTPTEELRRSIEDCPLIVQKKVDRAFEVRLVVIGEQLVAAKMVDTSVDGILDSRRAIRIGAMDFSRIEPPQRISEGCLAYLRSLDLRMGVFDFIVDRRGEWFFLECNEQGQFLFIEDRLPETMLLDRFCRWLMTLAGAEEKDLECRPSLSVAGFDGSPRAAELKREHLSHKKRLRAASVEYETEPA